MYGEQNEKQLKPSIVNKEAIEKMAEQFITMHPSDAVEAFKHLQKLICDERIRINQMMRDDSERLQKEIEAHRQGTDIIASAL